MFTHTFFKILLLECRLVLSQEFLKYLYFFYYNLTFSVPQKLKNSIFEIPIIPQTLNINSFNLEIIKKFKQYIFKNRCCEGIVDSCRFWDIAVRM